MEEEKKPRSGVRLRADKIKEYRCKNLIAVIEDPHDIKNIGTVIRNVNALGVEKVYVVDPRNTLPDDWEEMRDKKSLSSTSVSAVKWTFVKRFDSTKECFDHLETNNYSSMVTSPHVKGHKNIVLHEGDYTDDHKLAVWFGSESSGITDEAVKRSKACINVPMLGIIESLNLGTTSGIVLYEITKQRRAYQRLYSRRNKKGRKYLA